MFMVEVRYWKSTGIGDRGAVCRVEKHKARKAGRKKTRFSQVSSPVRTKTKEGRKWSPEVDEVKKKISQCPC